MKYPDPYDELTDEEFEDQFLRLLERERSVAVSFRFPQSLLDRAKVAAGNLEVPYQTLVKSIVEAGLERLERRSSAGADLRRRVRADSDLTAARTNGGARRRTPNRSKKPAPELERTSATARKRRARGL